MRHVLVSWEGPTHDRRPVKIVGHDGLTWTVTEVIEYWQHPDLEPNDRPPYGKVPYGSEAIRWCLTVTGPLPGRPTMTGPQQTVLVSYATGSGWYMDVV